MNVPEIIQKIIDHIHLAQDESVMHKEFYANPQPFTAKHELLFFIKPEITVKDDSIKLPEILEMMFNKIAKFKLNIRNISILGSTYLDKFNIIAQHYGVINAMSRKPVQSFSSEVSDKFRIVFGSSPDKVKLLGSLEFLDSYPGYNPVSLDELWQQSEAVKLGGGTYCARVTVKNEIVYLINGFHPRQLIHFTENGRSIVVFMLTGDLDWTSARNQFIGKTNPAEAMAGSLRNDLLMNQERYGLQSVSSSRNGFHLSAGPVEGLVELIRYCSDFSCGSVKTTNDFVFGKQLGNSFSVPQIDKICGNSLVEYNGKKISIFDLTEEMNSDTAIKLLKDCIL